MYWIFFLAIKHLIYYPDNFNRERDRGLLLSFSHFHIFLKSYQSGKPAKITPSVLSGMSRKFREAKFRRSFSLCHRKLLYKKLWSACVVSKHRYSLGAGRGTHQVNSMVTGSHSALLAECLLHTAAAGSKCLFFSVPCFFPCWSQKGGGCSFVPIQPV